MNHAINNVLMGLNNIGRVFCNYAAGVFVQSALLVILLLVVDLLLRRRVRAIFRYCLWMLVLVKLVLPPMLSLPTGVGYWVGDHLPASFPTSVRAFDLAVRERTSPFAEMPQVRPARDLHDNDSSIILAGSALTPLTWQAVLFVLWLVGVLAFLVVLVQRVKFVRGLIAASRPAKEELLGLLEQCRRQIDANWDISLRISDTIPSPAVCGFFRPIVLIPTPLVERLSPEGLRATLIHELAHIKRRDLWVNSVQTFLQVIYFYNPFVWFANSVIRRICEEAVDEMVLVTLGGQAKDYSNTLIDIGEMAFWRADLGLRLVGVAESKKALKWRIKHMLTRPIPKSSKLGALGIIVIFTVAAVLLPMARAQKPGEKSEPISGENQKEYTKPLHQAAANGDIEQVKLLISKGADVNEKDAWGKTPLHWACEKGHTEVAKLLISHGAEVNAVSSDHLRIPDWRKPLHYAAMGGHKQIVDLLINKGADINTPRQRGSQPWFEAMKSTAAGAKEVVELLAERGAEIPAMHLAAYMGDMEKLKQLLEEVVDVNAPAKYDFTALHAAANGGNKEVVEFLISKGAIVDARDNFGLTPLYYAAFHNHEQIMDLLLDKGADINLEENGYTLLYYAIFYDGDKAKDVIKLLISKGANVNAKSIGDYTPLIYAIWFDYGDIVEVLINNGADVNAQPADGCTPYYWAAHQGSKDLVELLTAKGATPVSNIHLAARAGDLEKVKAFLENGTDINAKDEMGRTPLYSALLADNSDVAKFLIAEGADVNAEDMHGFTPLHYFVHFGMGGGKEDLLETLIDKGANVNSKSNRGETPLFGAVYGDRSEIAELLIAKGANVDARSTRQSISGITPLYVACFHGYKGVAEVLIAKGADVNIKDSNAQTPLHVSCLNGYKDVVEFLIAKGADVDTKDNKEKTPLSLAREQGHDEIVRLLFKHGAKE